MKRFYKDVAITAERGITLDGRLVKTPAKAPLILRNAAMAEAVAAEWQAQGEDILPHSMPITGLANAAIDRVAPDPSVFIDMLSQYGETELLCYRADSPPELIARQDQVWNPVLDWARARYDISFTLVTGIMHQPQPAETLTRLRAAVAVLRPFTLAAFNPIVTISGSLILSLAVDERVITPDAAFDAAHLDELWQAELWGEDDFALQARAVHRRDFLGACRFLEILRDHG